MTVCGLTPSGNHIKWLITYSDPSSDFVSLALPQKATETHKLARGIVALFPNRRQLAQCPELVPAQRGVHLLNGLAPAQRVLTKLVPAQRPSKQGNLLTELVPDLLAKLVPAQQAG
ncbi:hypothetical protein PCANC_12366 [Puccinia coronata f. sp. avenae]|uniref:Uncharacterized protein n=1 Tax=Puccinia coronata f. sp. avenae TaxID=200324 RepID=A0A2N5UTT9_9BASI|nr:hypothetical protein PCASD_17432 [Puccinia coronata f. sp. avenae]PLW41169.1 hypothetical protein PCANC_12366 [Puccinia coronata f. sp. avenae]PLW50357.1 hypothetical protein PCASD_01673 [Puccinia coronata f. sp. avenae]